MCKARQYSDTMTCGPCGLQWDVNDPEPPQCLNRRTVQPVRVLSDYERAQGLRRLDEFKRSLD